MERNSFKEIEEEANMIARKTKLRIQMASSAKLSLKKKKFSPKGGKSNSRKTDSDEGDQFGVPKRCPIGRVLRSCLAAAQAFSSPDTDDHRADQEVIDPSPTLKLKATLNAVRAIIENEQARDFIVSEEISSKAEIPLPIESTSEDESTVTEIDTRPRREQSGELDIKTELELEEEKPVISPPEPKKTISTLRKGRSHKEDIEEHSQVAGVVSKKLSKASERSDQDIEKTFKVTEKAGKVTEKSGKSIEKSVKTAEKPDKAPERTNEKVDKVTGKTEKSAEKSEKTTDKSKKAVSKSEEVHEKSEKVHEKSEKVHEKSEKAHERSEKAHEVSKKQAVKSEKVSEKSKKSIEKSEKPSEKSVKLAEMSSEPRTESQQAEQKHPPRRGRPTRQQTQKQEPTTVDPSAVDGLDEETAEELSKDFEKPRTARPGRKRKAEVEETPEPVIEENNSVKEPNSDEESKDQIKLTRGRPKSQPPKEECEAVIEEVELPKPLPDAPLSVDATNKRRGRPKRIVVPTEDVQEDLVDETPLASAEDIPKTTPDETPADPPTVNETIGQTTSAAAPTTTTTDDQPSEDNATLQEDSSTEIETEAEPEKPQKIRLKQKSSDSEKSPPKPASKPAKSKKTVLKVALPIRPRCVQPAYQTAAEETSLAAPSSESSSPTSSSPKGSARIVRVNLKKKEPRSSNGSDTDTADETLDEEEKLSKLQQQQQEPQQDETKEEVNASPPATAPKKDLVTPVSSAPTIRTITVKMPSPNPAAASEASPAKKQKLDEIQPKPSLFTVPPVAQAKRPRKRKPTDDSSPKTTTAATATTAIFQPPVSKQPALASKPMVTIVSPMVITKPNVTIVTPQAIQTSTGQVVTSLPVRGVKPMVIQVPSNSLRGGLSGAIRTLTMPKIFTRPGQSHQIRSFRVSSPSLSTPRTSTPIMSRVSTTPQRILPSPIPMSGASTPTGNVMIRTVSVIGNNATGQPTRLVPHQMPIRPSIIRGPRLITTFGASARPRIISLSPGTPRMFPVRTMTGTIQPMRAAQTLNPAGKVMFRTMAPVVPQRHITVQATPSQPISAASVVRAGATANVVVQRPRTTIGGEIIIRAPTTQSTTRVIVKPTTATVRPQTQPQPQTVKKVVQQIVKPIERKAPIRKTPQPVRKAPVTIQKPIAPPQPAPQPQQSTSAVDKLLEEPQMPKIVRKPLSKKQRSMRKTDLIKTSSRTRRRGIEAQINYNEDRLLGIIDSEESNSEEEAPPAAVQAVEQDHQQHIVDQEQEEEDEEQQPQQDNIPVAVVEVFLSEDEVKLTEIHSPTKQELVDISQQQHSQAQSEQHEALGGQEAPEGFFTTEEGIVEDVVEGTFDSVVDKQLVEKSDLGDNTFAKTLVIDEDDSLLKNKSCKRKSNPLAKD